MDDFFSKYGWLVVVGVILIIVIVMATPVGEAIKNEIMDFIAKFGDRVSSGTISIIHGLPFFS